MQTCFIIFFHNEPHQQHENAGLRLASKAGAAFPKLFTSQLSRDSETPRSVSGPAAALQAKIKGLIEKRGLFAQQMDRSF
jgi:hypothetical protein